MKGKWLQRACPAAAGRGVRVPFDSPEQARQQPLETLAVAECNDNPVAKKRSQMVVFPLAFLVAHSEFHRVVTRSQDRPGASGLMDRLAFPGGQLQARPLLLVLPIADRFCRDLRECEDATICLSRRVESEIAFSL